FTAQDVGDLHQRVIDGVDQGVQRCAVGACHDVVWMRFCFEGHLTADQVIPGPILLWHAQAPDWLAAFCLECGNLLIGEFSVVVVMVLLRTWSCCVMSFFYLSCV